MTCCELLLKHCLSFLVAINVHNLSRSHTIFSCLEICVKNIFNILRYYMLTFLVQGSIHYAKENREVIEVRGPKLSYFKKVNFQVSVPLLRLIVAKRFSAISVPFSLLRRKRGVSDRLLRRSRSAFVL